MLARIFLFPVLSWFTLWGTLALWFKAGLPTPLVWLLCASYGLLGLLALRAVFGARSPKAIVVFALVTCGVLLWWTSLRPPATGDWEKEVARQTTGTIVGDTLTLNDMRSFVWHTADTAEENWITKTYDLSKLKSVDLFMSYWAGPTMAHLMISFEFTDGQYLTWSNEVRRAKGGSFSPVADFFKANPIAIIAADEQDVVGLRSNIQGAKVHLFRLDMPLEEQRKLLTAYVEAANRVAASPEWFNSVFSNCSRSVVTLARNVGINLPFDYRVLVNGYLPEYLYQHGAMNSSFDIEELYALGDITERARDAWHTPDYSAAVREGVPSP